MPKRKDPPIEQVYTMPVVEDSNENILADRIAYHKYITGIINNIALELNIDLEKIIPSKFSNICFYVNNYVYSKNIDLLWTNKRIDIIKFLKAYNIFIMVINDLNIAFLLKDFINFIGIDDNTIYNLNDRIIKLNSISNNDNTNIYNNINGVSFNNNNSDIETYIYNYNNINKGWQGLTLKGMRLVEMFQKDRLQSRVNRVTSGKVAFVPELAVLNHDFNYSNNNNMEQKEQIASGSLPKLSLSDGQKDRYLPNDD